MQQDSDSPKRADILAAATAVFLETGFAAASVDEIARRARVSKATVYSHFAGKFALFEAIVQGLCSAAVPGGEPQDLAGLPAEEALRRVGRKLLDLIFTDTATALYRVVVGEAGRVPDLSRAVYDTGPDRVAATLAACLAREAEAGRMALADPRRAAEQFLGLVVGQFHIRRTLGIDTPIPDTAARDALVEDAIRVFLRGVRARID